MEKLTPKKILRGIKNRLKGLLPQPPPPPRVESPRDQWLREFYTPFAQNERRRIYLSIARYAQINRPIKGHYFEFGCHSGQTMKLAWDNFHHLFDWNLFAFDSFEGLPEIEEIDKQEIWKAGKLRTDEDDFKQMMLDHGIPEDRLKMVKGFYSDSLTEDLSAQILPDKAAVVYIDCDLYASCRDILKWIPPFLQKGTIVVFDDWNCFHGDPEKGERKAWAEFLAEHPTFHFEPFVHTAEAQAFLCIRGA